MATILGLHYGHHGSACIVKDGKLIAGISSERLSRQKFSHGVTNELLDYLFSGSGINGNHIDYIALSDWNNQFAFDTIKISKDGKRIDDLWNSVYDNTCLILDADFRGRKIMTFYIGHQLAHASSAFYTSPFEESYCFSLDASGAKNKNNSLVSYGRGTTLTSLYCPGLMIGVAYGFFTEYLGLGGQMFKAGSTMALAGYGEVIPRVRDNFASYINGCFFPDDKDYHQWYLNLWKDLSDGRGYFKPEESDSEKAKFIASTIQYVFQHAIIQCVNNIEARGIKNLCLSGGSMLNCITNSFVLHEGQFENIHLFPGCGDDGGCVGTALYVAHHILGEERSEYTDAEICYLGPDKPVIDMDYSHLAQKIADGKIIAWCNGRCEYGPRALGNRSIFADPRNLENRDRINFKVKNREWFRPLAPIVMEEYASEWFDFPTKSPFMLFTAPIKQPDQIPAVNHVDGSARHQTVSEESNLHCYKLIKEFHSLTGVPMLLNTSLNVNGCPMVETNEDATEFFNLGTVDILVLNGEIFER